MFNKFIPNMNVIGVIVFIKLNFSIRTMKISLPSPAALNMGSYGGCPEMRRDGNARVETGIPFLTLPSSGWGQYLLLRDSKITRGSRLTVLFPTALALIWH